MVVTTSGLAAIYGTAGSARFVEPFVFPARFAVNTAGEVHEWRDTSGLTGRAGLAWQATAVAHFVAEGRRDSPFHSLDDAISVMRTIDAVRHQLAGDKARPGLTGPTAPRAVQRQIVP
jgi:hypothetical protein